MMNIAYLVGATSSEGFLKQIGVKSLAFTLLCL